MSLNRSFIWEILTVAPSSSSFLLMAVLTTDLLDLKEEGKASSAEVVTTEIPANSLISG